MVSAFDNPFQPGAGNFPPVRAGHENAAGDLRLRLRRILARKPGDIVILHGPRGNGKTTLLTELRNSVTGDNALARVLHIRTMRRSEDDVAQYLIRGKVPPKREVQKAGVSLMQMGGHLEYGNAPGMGIEEALTDILKDKSLLLCVDEAHEMCPEFGQHLFQVAQDCVSDKLPLLLVLAGTPLLQSRLSAMGASFWERSKRLRIGRLESDGEVRKALAQPAKAAGLPFDDEALDLLVEESQRYPYFVQMLGFHSWEAATSSGDNPETITLEHARRGVEEAEAERSEFYDTRLDEIAKQRVMAYAESVSKAMVGLGTDAQIPEKALERLLEETSARSDLSPVKAKERLAHLGLIWRGADRLWEPGIPSLCSYIVKHCSE